MERCDLLVVGGGPAGLAGALQARELGLSVVVLDDNGSPGGQIYRNVDGLAPIVRTVLGKTYQGGSALVRQVRDAGLDIRCNATVWHVSPDKVVHYLRDGELGELKAGAIMVATGAMERPFPVPGWTLPGVMTAGAAQIAMKAGAAIPQGRIVLAGCGPLLYLVASQLIGLGADIEAILDTTPRRNYWKAVRHARFGPAGFLQILDGLKMLRKISARRIRHVKSLEIVGEGKAECIVFTAAGRSETIAADCFLLHHGVVPNVQLLRHLGCEFAWSEAQACFLPRLDRNWRTSVPGIYAVGDNARIMGADAARLCGRLAAFAAADDLSRKTDGNAEAALGRAFSKADAIRPFLDALYRPAARFRLPDRQTVACRCESVTAGEISDLAGSGCLGPNQAKFFSRCGMGPCQGRNCGLTVTELFAAASGRSHDEIGYYNVRSPIRPLPMDALARMKTEGVSNDVEFS